MAYFNTKVTTSLFFFLLFQCHFLVQFVIAGSSETSSFSQIQVSAKDRKLEESSQSRNASVFVLESPSLPKVELITPKNQSLMVEKENSSTRKKKLKLIRSKSKVKTEQQSSSSVINDTSNFHVAKSENADLYSELHYGWTKMKPKGESILKGLTDLVLYGLHNRNLLMIGEARTGLMLFAGITMLELVTVSTLFFGLTGAIIMGLVAMVKLMAAGSIIMIG